MSAARLGGDEAELFRAHHAQLVCAVAGRVKASDALIEDACAYAWAQLLRSRPRRGPTLFAWLRTVAVREAWRLSRRERRELALEDLAFGEDHDGEGGWEEVLAATDDLERQLDARGALGSLAELPHRERRYLSLRIAGFSYREIASLEGVTYTNVNRRLTRARARLRQVAETA